MVDRSCSNGIAGSQVFVGLGVKPSGDHPLHGGQDDPPTPPKASRATAVRVACLNMSALAATEQNKPRPFLPSHWAVPRDWRGQARSLSDTHSSGTPPNQDC